VRDDAFCLVLYLKPRFGISLMVGLGVPYSEDRVVVLQISSYQHQDYELTYLGGGDCTVLVDDISQKECLCVPLLDQLVGLDCQRSDLFIHLCLLCDKLISVSFVLLDLSNLFDQSIDFSSQVFGVVICYIVSCTPMLWEE
jgi:hypothetical protein